MYLELHQVDYVEGTPTYEQLNGFRELDPGYGLIRGFVGRRDVIVVCAATSFGGVDDISEVIDALRHHQMTFARGDALGRPYPFAARAGRTPADGAPGQWHERTMYLHDFTPDQVEEARRAVG